MFRSSFFRTMCALVFALTAACGSDEEADGSGSGGAVRNCSDLCALAPVSSQVGSCVSEFITLKGYDTSDPRCSNANTPSGCNSCYDAIHVSDADCAAAHDKCF